MSWSSEIVEWQQATFGDATPDSAIDRACEEWGELLEALEEVDPGADVAEEAADIVIVLSAFVATLGHDLAAAVAAKMGKNRARKWVRTTAGCGQHVESDE